MNDMAKSALHHTVFAHLLAFHLSGFNSANCDWVPLSLPTRDPTRSGDHQKMLKSIWDSPGSVILKAIAYAAPNNERASRLARIVVIPHRSSPSQSSRRSHTPPWRDLVTWAPAMRFIATKEPLNEQRTLVICYRSASRGCMLSIRGSRLNG